jgi:hypothetical protein
MRCLTEFQEVYRELAARRNCLLVDGQALFHVLGPHGMLNDDFFHDAMHPSLRGHIALAQAILEVLHARRAFGWPADAPRPVVDPAACAAHFGLDTKAWISLCENGALFYYRIASVRHDRSERRAKELAFREAGKRIGAGEPPEGVGLPNIGVPLAAECRSR